MKIQLLLPLRKYLFAEAFPLYKYLPLLACLIAGDSSILFAQAGSREALFIENKGQIADMSGKVQKDILYSASTGNIGIYFRKNGFSYVIGGFKAEKGPLKQESSSEKSAPISRVDLQFEGADTSVQVYAEEPSEQIFNYYFSHCPKGITGLKGYKRLAYRNLYPGIDILFFFPSLEDKGPGMMYDYIIRPGGDPADIKVKYSGADVLQLISPSTLFIGTGSGLIKENIPLLYQTSAFEAGYPPCTENKIHGELILRDSILSFNIPVYNKALTLVIDPWMTYLGGSDADGDITDGRWSTKVITDDQNDIYITGSGGASYPTTAGTFQAAYKNLYDVFVSKFTTGERLLWSTYIGGSLADRAGDIALDDLGHLTVVGYTESTNFPTVIFPGAYYRNTPAYINEGAAYIAQLNAADGTGRWITYYGGQHNVGGSDGLPHFTGVATDNAGDLFITGFTTKDPDVAYAFPVPPGVGCSGIQQEGKDGFLLRFSSDGVLRWGTFLNGSANDWGYAVATDAGGNAYVTGRTNSIDFLNTPKPAASGLDVFIAAFDSDPVNCNQLWVRYLSGNGAEAGYGITASNGNVYVCGNTSSDNFPATVPLITTRAGGNDAFMTCLAAANGNVLWSTYFGGSQDDIARDISITASGDPIIIGSTKSANIPVSTNAIQPVNDGSEDIFLTLRDRLSGNPVCATYYGGLLNDLGSGIAVDTKGMILLCGSTASEDFPTITSTEDPLAYNQLSKRGTRDAFLGKLCSSCGREPVKVPITGTPVFSFGDSTRLIATGGDTYLWNTGETNDTINVKPLATGTYTYIVTVSVGSCSVYDTFVVTVVVPIELLSFKALANEKGNVLLQWHTGSEWNNRGFHIERSSDGQSFSQLAEVNGAGNSSSANRYEWHDNDPYPGINYYRLKQTDLDGNYSYSPVVSVRLGSKSTIIYPVYPNPADQSLSLKMEAYGTGQLILSISDVFGQILREYSERPTEGENTLLLDVGDLPAGMYVLRVSYGQEESRYFRWVKKAIAR